MILRKITQEEVAAITTLIQRAENIGAEAFTEEDIRYAIEEVYAARTPQRQKDCDTKWIIDFMVEVKHTLVRRDNGLR